MLASVTYPPVPMVHIGGLMLSVHGLFVGLGIIAGGWIALRRFERMGGDRVEFQAVLTFAVVGALIGARFLTVPAALLNGAGWQAFNPLDGNFSILGGFTGGIITGVWRMRRAGMPVLPALDASAPGLALGTIVGRLGCLAIAEHLGPPTTLPWGYAVMPGYDLAPQHTGLECATAAAGSGGVCGVYQPVAAYDLIGAGLLLVVLVVVARRVSLGRGTLFVMWMTWYGLQRFGLDFLRRGDASIGPVTWNQVVGLVAALLGASLIVLLRRRTSHQPIADESRGRRREDLAIGLGRPSEFGSLEDVDPERLASGRPMPGRPRI